MVTIIRVQRQDLICPGCGKTINYVDHMFIKATAKEQVWADKVDFNEYGWDKGRLLLVTKGSETYQCPICGYKADNPDVFLVKDNQTQDNT